MCLALVATKSGECRCRLVDASPQVTRSSPKRPDRERTKSNAADHTVDETFVPRSSFYPRPFRNLGHSNSQTERDHSSSGYPCRAMRLGGRVPASNNHACEDARQHTVYGTNQYVLAQCDTVDESARSRCVSHRTSSEAESSHRWAASISQRQHSTFLPSVPSSSEYRRIPWFPQQSSADVLHQIGRSSALMPSKKDSLA